MIVTNKEAALKGANVLLSWVIAQIVFFVLQTAAYRLFNGQHERLQALFELVWLAMTVWMAVGLIFIATAVDRPGLVWTVIGLSAFTAVLSLVFTFALRHVESGARWWLVPISTVESLISIAERICFLLVMVKLAGPKRSWALMVALVAGGITVLRLVFSLSLSFAVVNFSSVMDWYPYVMSFFGLIAMSCSVALVIGARSTIAEGSDGAGAPVATTSAPPVSPTADFLIGAALLGGGVIVTVLSYSIASSGSGGGRYLVATGLIGVGIGRLIRGFIRLGKQ